VCACRVEASFHANVCFHGNCVTDADCAGGYCSPSAVDVFWNCLTGLAQGSIGYFCHSASDECTDDAECGEGGHCIFEVDAARFGCFTPVCTK
jgi:hypothetical protein